MSLLVRKTAQNCTQSHANTHKNTRVQQQQRQRGECIDAAAVGGERKNVEG